MRDAQRGETQAADGGEHQQATEPASKLSELVKRAQAGDHRALRQLQRIRDRRRAKGSVHFTDAEAGTVEAGAFASHGGGADAALGVTDGLEEHEGPENAVKEGLPMMQDGTSRLASDMAEGPAAQVAGRAVLLPRLIGLVQAHKYREAIALITDSYGVEERLEVIVKLAEHTHMSERLIDAFKHFAKLGLIYDVLKLGWDWTYGGIKAVQDAHERGDRDSRIAIYAWAWADCVLLGHHSNPGAATAEQREAMEKGMQDGLATRELSPEMGELLIAQYGSQPNAKRALEDALLARAGFTGVRTHA